MKNVSPSPEFTTDDSAGRQPALKNTGAANVSRPAPPLVQVRLGRKKWLVGFEWIRGGETAAPPHTAVRDIRRESGQRGADIAVLFGAQAGIGASGGRRYACMGKPSLAACLHPEALQTTPPMTIRRTDPFAGLFQLTTSDGRSIWWLFARTNGENCNGWCDRVYTSEQQARADLQLLLCLLPTPRNAGAQPQAPALPRHGDSAGDAASNADRAWTTGEGLRLCLPQPGEAATAPDQHAHREQEISLLPWAFPVILCLTPRASEKALLPGLQTPHIGSRILNAILHRNCATSTAALHTPRTEGIRLLCLAIPAGIALLMGGLRLYTYLDAAGLTPGAAKREQLIADKRAAIAANPAILWPQTWRTCPPVSTVILDALRFADDVPVSLDGWKWKQSTVQVRTPSGTHAQGPSLLLQAAYTPGPGAQYTDLPADFAPPSGAKGENKGILTLRRQLAGPGQTDRHPPSARTASLLREDQVRALLTDIAHASGCSLQLRFSRPAQKALPPAGTFICPWSTGIWSMQGIPRGLARTDIPARLSMIPGLTLTSLSCSGRTWTAKGELHAITHK